MSDWGLAYGLGQRAKKNAQTAWEWKAAAERRLAYIRKLEQRISKAETQLKVKQCDVAGTDAQNAVLRDALAGKVDPDSLKKVVGKLKSGKDQTVLGKIYANAFRAKAEEIGLQNPENYLA